MNESKIVQRLSLGGSALAVLTAPLCCVAPLTGLVLGATGFAVAAALDKWRPVFLAASFLLVTLAWYLTYRRRAVLCDKRASASEAPWNRLTLWFATGFIGIAFSFPLLSSTAGGSNHSMSCCEATTAQTNTLSPTPDAGTAPRHISPGLISLYQVPLVCPAAPQIGCGSHAKPVLLGLEEQPAVSQAWLNRGGTIMALVWKPKTKLSERASALKAVAQNEGLDVRELQGAARTQVLKDFLSGGNWYRGREVDRLSEEEAGIIAARLVKRMQARIVLSDETAKALKTDLEELFKRRFTGTGNQDEPTAEAAVLKVLKAHLDEKDVAVLKETLPKNGKPLAGEQ